MNKKTILLAGLLAVLIGVALFFYNRLGTGVRGEGPTTVAPPVTSSSAASDQAASSELEDQRVKVPTELSFTDRDGNIVTTADLVGTPTVINFWASWCVYCRKEMPDFLTVYRELGDEVRFVMLNVPNPGQGETREVGEQYFEKNGFDELPLYFDDQDNQMAWAFGATGLPMTFFLDSEGYLVAYEPGMTNADRLRKGIEMIRKGPEPILETEGTSAASEEEVFNPSWCTMAPAYQKIDAESAKNMIDEFANREGLVILDVRTEAEYNEQHIPGAIVIAHDQLAQRAAAELPDQRAVILVYCRTGRRSEEAANTLVELGYNHVYDFGGIVDWPYDTVTK